LLRASPVTITVADTGIVFGHENMGVVEEVGSGVSRIQRGDRGCLWCL